MLHIGRAFGGGDIIPYTYGYKTIEGEMKEIMINKLGLTILVLTKNIECFEIIFKNCTALLNSQEILDMSIILANENWKSAI